MEEQAIEKIPKVFISYSWTSYDHENKVIQLAERLMSHGVSVVLDKWDLKEGQDKYVFMEQAVTDPEIDRVLLICDKVYTEKADKRAGGVGDETTIITSELYGRTNQEKFIPVIFEVDEDNNPYCPTYAKSRIYIDLSADDSKYETEYEKLLRNIHEKPLYKKPAIGKKPEWLEDDTIDLSMVRDLLRQIKGYTGTNRTKADILVKRFIDAFHDSLISHTVNERSITGEVVVETINKLKPLRDLYLDFLESHIILELPLVDMITTFMETTYNKVLVCRTDSNSYTQREFECFRACEKKSVNNSFL